MNLIKLSWCYLKAKPLSTILSLILVTLGVSLVSIMFLIRYQFEERLYRNIEGIDLVISAKGSPLQMVLSSIYHVDIPTGNIPMSETWKVTKSKFVEKAIPLALGDSYEGHRIVGTDHQYHEHYNIKIAKGEIFDNDLEVTLGALVAQRLELKVGDTFYGAHGLDPDAGNRHVHDDHAYHVVGIFERSNTVIDQLILTHYSSVWRIHESHDHEDEEGHNHDTDEHNHDDHNHDTDEHNHDNDEGQPTEKNTDSTQQIKPDSTTKPEQQQNGHDHDHDGHDHDHNGHDHDHDGHDHDHNGHDHDHNGHDHGTDLGHLDSKGREMTAYLIQYKLIPVRGDDGKETGKMETSSMAGFAIRGMIDNNIETLGYAEPVFQLYRLLEITGVGKNALFFLAFIIAFISAFSVFISLYSSLKDRRYEIALMRTMGASQMKIFMMVILEGLMIVLAGLFFGLLVSHVGMSVLAGRLQDSYQYEFSGMLFLLDELWMVLATLGIGFVASLLPAVQAYSTQISSTLAKN